MNRLKFIDDDISFDDLEEEFFITDDYVLPTPIPKKVSVTPKKIPVEKKPKAAVECKCQYRACGKTFLAEKARLNSKSKPKFCSLQCYAKNRVLPPGEAQRRRIARSKQYYIDNPEYFRQKTREKKLKNGLSDVHTKRVQSRRDST